MSDLVSPRVQTPYQSVVKVRGSGDDGDGNGSCGSGEDGDGNGSCGEGDGDKVEDVDGRFRASVMSAFCDEPS